MLLYIMCTSYNVFPCCYAIHVIHQSLLVDLVIQKKRCIFPNNLIEQLMLFYGTFNCITHFSMFYCTKVLEIWVYRIHSNPNIYKKKS